MVDIDAALDEADRKAWEALARYKFMMFGFWAAFWVHLNKISGQNRSNPWKPIVIQARRLKDEWLNAKEEEKGGKSKSEPNN